MNKKGDLTALFLIGVFVVIMGAMILIGQSLISDISTNVNESGAFSSDAQTIISDVNARYVSVWDNLFLMLFIGAWAVLLVSFYFLDSHPALALVGIIAIIVFMLLSPILSNMYDGFASNAAMDSSGFVKMNYILDHYLIFAIAMGISGIAVMYAKGRLG